LQLGDFNKMNKFVNHQIQTTFQLLLTGLILAGVGCSSGRSPNVPVPVAANEQIPDELEVREVKERFSSHELIEQFDEGVEDEYHFGPGDRIYIEVWDRPELSGTYIIGPDGGILLPIAGSFKLAELSRDEAVAAVSKRLSKYYIEPDVTVRVEEYASNTILVLGRVAKPGAIRFDKSPTLLEAITLAGGLPVGGVGADDAALTRCAVFRGKDRVIWIDLTKLLSGEELALNIRLRRQDVLYIPDAADQLVYVMGEVTQAGAYNLSPDMSLLSALMQAGGPSRDAADRVFLIRSAPESSVEIAMGDLISSPASLNFQLAEGDVVYVPERGLSKVGYVLEIFSPLTGFLVFGSAIAR